MKKDKKIYEFNDHFYNQTRNLMALDLKDRIIKMMDLYNYKDIVILCIGTDKIIGDSYGPRVGSELIKNQLPYNVSCFGTRKNTLNAVNIESFIDENLENSLVIVVDAIVSPTLPIGLISVSNSGIYPGKGAGKTLPLLGDISICGVVSNSSENSYIDCLNIKKEKIIKMSNITADALSYSLCMVFEDKINYNMVKKFKNLVMKKFIF